MFMGLSEEAREAQYKVYHVHCMTEAGVLP